MDPNEDVIKLDCGHYDLESLSYQINEHTVVCPRCFSRIEREQTNYEFCPEARELDRALIDSANRREAAQEPSLREQLQEQLNRIDAELARRKEIKEQAARAILFPFTFGLTRNVSSAQEINNKK